LANAISRYWQRLACQAVRRKECGNDRKQHRLNDETVRGRWGGDGWRVDFG